jgi:nicotinamidase-related amidase/RimJ/RimL family protein N-acetyltransferase
MSGHVSGTAIVIIDMVGDMFRREELVRQRGSLVKAVNALTGAGRDAGLQVIWIREEHAPDLSDAPLELQRNQIRVAIAGTPGAELLPELDVAPSDRVIIKKRYSAFFGTDLDDRLRREHIDKLVLAGVNTHACVRTTAIDAYQRDYDVQIVRDCVASYDPAHHDISLRYIDGKIARVAPLYTFLTELGSNDEGASTKTTPQAEGGGATHDEMCRIEFTDRRWLRLLEESDAQELHSVIEVNRDRLARWMPWAAGQSFEDTLAFVRRTREQLVSNDGFQTAVIEDGQIVGVAGFHGVSWQHRSTSIGYWLAATAQGRGVMTSAVAALVDHALRTWQLHRVEIRAAVDNGRSRAIPERLGFTQEGVLHDAERIGERYTDQVVYAKLGE